MAQLNGLGDYQVLLDAGWRIDAFRLDNPTSGVLDSTYVLDGTVTFVEVTQYTQSVNISRGRQKYRQPIDAGRCTIRFLDETGAFTVVNSSSPYWDPDLNRLGFQPTRRVRITRNGSRIFDGQIVTYDQEVTLENQSVITVTATDDLKQFDNILISTFTPTAERSDQRLVTILTRPEVNVFTASGDRVMDTGDANLGTQVVENGVAVSEYFQRVQVAEQGRIFIDRTGRFVFQKRIPSRVVQSSPVTLSDAGGGGVPYRNFKVVYE